MAKELWETDDVGAWVEAESKYNTNCEALQVRWPVVGPFMVCG